MKILLSILLNGLILMAITYFLGANETLGITSWVLLGCWDCGLTSIPALKIFLIGGIILGIINITIRPILKILSLPLYLLFLGLVTFVVNGIVLKLFSYIMNDVLAIPWVEYSITGLVNFVIAVAIFTILNTLYGLIISKK